MANIIDRIGKLKNIGSFKGFTPPKDLAFKEVNLFYGYNGSGKTTLTRVLSSLGDGVCFVDFTGWEIDISCNGVSIKDFTATNIGGKVKVFNEDFVANNLELKSQKAKKLSAVVGAGNIGIKKELEELEEKKERLKDKTGELKAKGEMDAAVTAYNNLETEVARNIRSSLQIAKTQDYTKKHFATYYTAYKASPVKKTITEDEYQKKASFYVAGAKLEIEGKYTTALNRLGSILPLANYATIFDLLKAPIKRKGAHLKEEVIKWIEEGAKLHEDDHDACKFCGQGIAGATWKARTTEIQELIKKDDEFEWLDGSLTAAKTAMAEYTDIMKTFSCDLAEAHFLTKDLFKEYQTVRTTFDAAYSDFGGAFRELADKVEEKDKRKDTEILFNDTEGFNNKVIQLNNAITNTINAIGKNNLDVQESDRLKQQGKELVINFHIQQNEVELNRAESDMGAKTAAYKQAVADLQALDEDINKKKAALENQADIITEINTLLEKTLDVGLVFKIEAGASEYQLERKIDGAPNQPANNLSEGEKNLIAFLYFLVSLKSSSKAEKKNEIIVIDDPVSSLDSNNIFVLQDLVVKILVQYGQQFFLTHNFYFFAKVQEALRASLRGLDKKEEDALEIFEVKKVKGRGSEIRRAGKYIKSYISEYMSLIDSLKAIWEENDDEKNVATGNMVRRVLEVFASFKNTNKNGSLFIKMKQLTGDDTRYQSLLSMAHAFSHTLEITSITDDATFSYVAGKQEIGELFAFMQEKDPEHFEGFGIKLGLDAPAPAPAAGE
ncbi:MAG: AAA family ATPase [Alphaproteobacteria bacterium]|nr:AAA family ATPase [Alphaproteobacteria bacterium]